MVKDTIKVGVGSMAGMGIIGSMGSMPGMPSNNISSIASAGFTLANVGQLSKNAMGLTRMMDSNTDNKKKIMPKWR